MRIYLIGLALCSTAPLAAKAPRVEPVVTGSPVKCILLRDIRNTRVINDRTIDFQMSSRKIYRNTLPQACPQLGFQKAFAYQTSITQLCSVDLISVIIPGGGLSPGAVCGLGKFTPIEFPTGK